MSAHKCEWHEVPVENCASCKYPEDARIADLEREVERLREIEAIVRIFVDQRMLSLEDNMSLTRLLKGEG